LGPGISSGRKCPTRSRNCCANGFMNTTSRQQRRIDVQYADQQ
jgi:hypothetical protein